MTQKQNRQNKIEQKDLQLFNWIIEVSSHNSHNKCTIDTIFGCVLFFCP